MIVGVPKEILEHEGRVAAIPETVHEYTRMGLKVIVQASAGEAALHDDAAYHAAGAGIVPDPAQLFRTSDLVIKVKQPYYNQAVAMHEAEMIREGATLVAFLHPAAPANHSMVRLLASRNITALSMDAIPRISRAQPMDALTSMSTVSGYKAVLLAANRFPKFIPMTGTTLGTLQAATFLIVGTGVVGLQAIATAKRLGGNVVAVDVREEARRTAASLGAKVAGFEVPQELAIAPAGRARSLPDQWTAKLREALAPLMREADIVILSALVPGEIAPVLVTDAMIAGMKPGSIIVDVAVDQGGNCDATPTGGEVTRHGVSILGLWNIPGSMPVHGSWLYAHNMLHYVRNLFKKGLDTPDLQDEIAQQSLVTHQGRIVHQGTLKAMELA